MVHILREARFTRWWLVSFYFCFLPMKAKSFSYGFALFSLCLFQTRFTTVFQTVLLHWQIRQVHGIEPRWFQQYNHVRLEPDQYCRLGQEQLHSDSNCSKHALPKMQFIQLLENTLMNLFLINFDIQTIM